MAKTRGGVRGLEGAEGTRAAKQQTSKTANGAEGQNLARAPGTLSKKEAGPWPEARGPAGGGWVIWGLVYHQNLGCPAFSLGASPMGSASSAPFMLSVKVLM